jgi:hypothetical protein
VVPQVLRSRPPPYCPRPPSRKASGRLPPTATSLGNRTSATCSEQAVPTTHSPGHVGVSSDTHDQGPFRTGGVGPWSRTTSPLSRSSPFPPVVEWLVDDHRRCDLHLKVCCRTSTIPSPPASIGREHDRPRRHPVHRPGSDRRPPRREQLALPAVRRDTPQRPHAQPVVPTCWTRNEATHHRPDEGHLPGRRPLDRVDSGLPPIAACGRTAARLGRAWRHRRRYRPMWGSATKRRETRRRQRVAGRCQAGGPSPSSS